MIYIVKYLRCGEMGIKCFLSLEEALREFFENLQCFDGDPKFLSEIQSLVGRDIDKHDIGQFSISASKDRALIEVTHDNYEYISLEQLQKPRKIIDWIEMINRNFEL